MPRSSLVLAAAGLVLAAVAGAAESPERTFDPATRVFRSAAEPELLVKIAPGYDYLGRLEFPLEDVARVDRHFWAATDVNGRVESLIVLQFEGFLPAAEGAYRFVVPPEGRRAGGDFRFSPEPVRLGSHDYVHNTWVFDHEASARENPGRESARTVAFVAERGLTLDAGLVMSRFVRAVGADARREVILFYMEPIARSGHSLADFPGDGPAGEAIEALSDDVTRRSFAAFRVLPEVAPGGAVVYLVRHAETVYPPPTDAPRDPPLTDAGEARAVELARVLADAGVERVWSTDLRRTLATAQPLAERLGLEIELYDPNDLPAFAAALAAAGGRHLVSGHSNTTPELVELLGGEGSAPIDEPTEFDRLYAVALRPGEPPASILLRYGELSRSVREEIPLSRRLESPSKPKKEKTP